MIMPIDIDKKEFTRDKRGYNSREVDEFLDLIVIDYERVLNDNRSMAHKIKALEKQLAEAQKSDTAMLETLETAKKLMADISASAERRAELIMRDAELEAENMILDAKMTVKKINEEHLTLKSKVERLRSNYKAMLTVELNQLEGDEYNLLPDLDRSDIAVIDEQLGSAPVEETHDNNTIVVNADDADNPLLKVSDLEHASLNDLEDSLGSMTKEEPALDDTIIIK